MKPDESIDEYNTRKNAEATAAWHAANPGAHMPNVSQMIQSKYLSKGDVPVPVIATIKGLSLERFNQAQRDGDKMEAWILWFVELPKGLKLNTTNIRVLEASFGPESDAWVGKRVQVYVDPSIQMAGQAVGGIRLKGPTRPAVDLTRSTGWPGTGATAAPAVARFDPMTGKPLAVPAAVLPKFDPMTGQPMVDAVAAVTGYPVPSSGVDPEFDDEIPF